MDRNKLQSKWIIWGTGKKGQELYENLVKKSLDQNIIAVVDTDKEKWGSIWNGYVIEQPDIIRNKAFNKLIIAMAMWRTVYRNIIDKYGIQQERIDNHYFLQRTELLDYYAKVEISIEEEKQLNYIKKYPLDIFNDTFPEKYLKMNIEVYLDESVQMYYVYYHGKKMYFPKDFNIDRVKGYYRQILIEQDMKSPHKYQDSNFMVGFGEVVLDIGAAEGNFSLDVIDKVKKIYLVESDKRWIEALEKTFAPYKEKVNIIQKCVCDYCDNECITIDELAKLEHFTSIKMDIEGAEIVALKGGKNFLNNFSPKVFICCYHAENHYKEISGILIKLGYSITTTNGYMVFLYNINLEYDRIPKLVKGVIRAQKI